MSEAQALQRKQIRQHIRQQRRQLTPQQQQQAAQQVAKNFLDHPRLKKANNIALFLSFDGEIDTRPLIQQLWQLNKQIYLPVLHPFSKHNLLFLRYSPQSKLVKNHYKIDEPPLDVQSVLPINQLDIMIIPLVAFDLTGQRLGMGGGFYDRTLAHWQKNGFYPIGLAHDCQLVEHLPAAHWDIPLPEIITPQKRWQW